ncbi:glycosyl hydrolase family 18 protein [Pelotomaculum terephthalicicum JT]|uniref:glycosyl hydrolase family 18 protein n=1 Tax=Pelotomaculum terephthalicicum TaxID=206393 RepID=UPI0009CDDF94|nr:glycosyl hydrolase family 18 protein [Pelotomaculum terephthalicicum]MCG9969406.1 glycosyl hydrolase family 18 protein [Pelotomaculum terephthalicicum JT]OPY63103.1 MAG: putative sporulation-specific glycosylase YdhD [Pelotomaculum sp. PtaU1.Bin065]
MYFYPYFENNWYYATDPDALASLYRHGKEITMLIPFWYGVTGQGTLVDQSDQATLNLARQFNIPVLAIVHNFAARQYGPLIHRLLTDNNLRKTLIANIRSMLLDNRFIGVNIDFEFVPPEDRAFMTAFMAELNSALKPCGLLVTISLPPELRDDPAHPFSGAFSYPDLARYSDQVYILAYDEHVAEPGPIASIGFVRQVLAYALTVIPRWKIRLGMAVYGRDWSAGETLPQELSYRDAVVRAAAFGAEIRYDEKEQEPTYSYTERGINHVVWFENARSFAVKLDLARRENIPGIGVWRLGLEDQEIWRLFKQQRRYSIKSRISK